MARELVVPWSSASTYFDMFFSLMRDDLLRPA
jgi:hypothetical protein